MLLIRKLLKFVQICNKYRTSTCITSVCICDDEFYNYESFILSLNQLICIVTVAIRLLWMIYYSIHIHCVSSFVSTSNVFFLVFISCMYAGARKRWTTLKSSLAFI